MRPGAAVSLSCIVVLLGLFEDFKCVLGFLCYCDCRFDDAKAVSTTEKEMIASHQGSFDVRRFLIFTIRPSYLLEMHAWQLL